MHSVVRGTGTPKDRDEVNKRDACEWDGWVCERDVICAPSIFKLTHRVATLARVLPTFFFRKFRLLWIVKARAKDKNDIRMSVRWKAKKLKLRNLHASHVKAGVRSEKTFFFFSSQGRRSSSRLYVSLISLSSHRYPYIFFVFSSRFNDS